jgi:MFS family permease
LIGGLQLALVGWGLFAGTLIDRHNRKHLFMVNNTAGAIVLASASAFGYFVTPGGMPVVVLGLVMATTYMIFSIHYPNLYAFLQELFPPSWYGRVYSMVEFQGQLTNAIGMAVGAMLLDGTESLPWWPADFHITAWPMHKIFLMNACTYAAALSIISLIRYQMRERGAIARQTVRERLRTGLRYLNRNRPLLAFGLCSYAIFFGTLTFYPVILPAYINDVLQAEGAYMGLSESVFALGALGMGTVGIGLSRWMARQNKIQMIMALLGIAVLMMAAMAVAPSTAMLLGMSVVFGLVNSGARIIRLTYILNIVPNEVIGRVNSTLSISNALARSLFILLIFPALALSGDALQSRWGIAVVALVNTLALLTMIRFYPRFDHQRAYG